MNKNPNYGQKTISNPNNGSSANLFSAPISLNSEQSLVTQSHDLSTSTSTV